MTKLFPYQVEGVQKIEAFKGRALLADQMGLGKSIMCLEWLKTQPSLRPALIICPAFLKYNWERECKIHMNWRSEVLESQTPYEPSLVKPSISIINYDILQYWMEYLAWLNPRVVIADECHFCSNRSAIRTKCLRQLAKKVPHVIAVSGTPLTNRPAELWPVLNLLRPDLFPRFFPFAEEFIGPKRKPWGWDFSGAKNLRKLHTTLASTVMIRRLKKDVLQDLPNKQRFIVPLPIKNRKEYDSCLANFASWLTKIKPGNVTRALRAEKLVKLGYLRRLVAQLKMASVIAWLHDLLDNSKGKLIIFAVHKKVISELEKEFKGSCVKVDGSVIGRKRQKAFDQFIHTKKTRILIGNIKAAGVGWSALGVPNTAFVELPWTPGEVTQAEDRSHGLGRGVEGKSSSFYFLVAHDTVEEKLAKILQAKQETLTKTLDGKGRGNELNLWDLLEEAILEEARK